jgi:hypothetical protein
MHSISIHSMSAADWPAVQAIYAEGIAGGSTTFETQPPEWEATVLMEKKKPCGEPILKKPHPSSLLSGQPSPFAFPSKLSPPRAAQTGAVDAC